MMPAFLVYIKSRLEPSQETVSVPVVQKGQVDQCRLLSCHHVDLFGALEEVVMFCEFSSLCVMSHL